MDVEEALRLALAQNEMLTSKLRALLGQPKSEPANQSRRSSRRKNRETPRRKNEPANQSRRSPRRKNRETPRRKNRETPETPTVESPAGTTPRRSGSLTSINSERKRSKQLGSPDHIILRKVFGRKIQRYAFLACVTVFLSRHTFLICVKGTTTNS